jgi:hypothetical protein
MAQTLRYRSLALSALLVLSVPAACSLFVDVEDLPQAPVDAASSADAAVRDTGVSVDAGFADASTDVNPAKVCVLPNLLPNGDFEQGLGGWSGAAGIVSEAHGGIRALRTCGGFGGNSTAALQNLPSPHPSARYFVRAWAKKRTDAGAQAGSFAVFLYDTKFGSQASINRPAWPDSPAWRCADAITVAPNTLNRVGLVGFSVDSDAGHCIDFDDVEIFELPDSGTVPPECLCPLQ